MTDTAKPDTPAKPSFLTDEGVRFDYLKSNLFRVQHASGAWGGVSGNGKICISFYSERPPIPQQEVCPVGPDGRLGAAVKSVSRAAMIREVESCVIMDLEVAESLAGWISKHAASLRAARAKLETAPTSQPGLEEPK